MIAGDEAERQVERVVQPPARRQVLLVAGAVERHVARIQHQVGSRGGQMRADAQEVGHEVWLLAAEMGVGDLRDAKGHGLR